MLSEQSASVLQLLAEQAGGVGDTLFGDSLNDPRTPTPFKQDYATGSSSPTE
eukprot:gene23764-9936_t